MQPAAKQNSWWNPFSSSTPTEKVSRPAPSASVQTKTVTGPASKQLSYNQPATAAKKLPVTPVKNGLREGEVITLPNGQTRIVKFMTPEQEADVKFRVHACLEIDRKADIKIAALEAEKAVLVKEMKEHEQSAAATRAETAEIRKRMAQEVINKEIRLTNKITAYQVALSELPNNWEKTGKDQQTFNLISGKIKDAIQVINSYRIDFKDVSWVDEMDSRADQMDKTVETVDKLIILVNHWKSQ